MKNKFLYLIYFDRENGEYPGKIKIARSVIVEEKELSYTVVYDNLKRRTFAKFNVGVNCFFSVEDAKKYFYSHIANEIKSKQWQIDRLLEARKELFDVKVEEDNFKEML